MIYQLDHMQTICTSLQTDNLTHTLTHTNTRNPVAIDSVEIMMNDIWCNVVRAWSRRWSGTVRRRPDITKLSRFSTADHRGHGLDVDIK